MHVVKINSTELPSAGLVPKNDKISSDHYPSILSVISNFYRHSTRSYFVFHIVLLSGFNPALYDKSTMKRSIVY